MSPEKYQEKLILVVYVPGGDNRPYKAPKTLGDKKSERVYWIRKGSASVIVNKQDEQRLIELAKKIPFDDRTNPQSSIDDLSLPIIQSFLKEVKSELYQQSSKIPFEELCQKMNVVKGSVENIRPLNVGLLLFSENPENHFRGAIIGKCCIS